MSDDPRIPDYPEYYADPRTAPSAANMTLRDHLAGLAMQGMIATYEDDPEAMIMRRNDYAGWAKLQARSAYFIADAMLAERAKKS